ncbi:hypothetical protein [Pseudomonas sp. PDM31]|uniref:hypothetical protein n=1 Tax=Pseudomonas sp. PDM31 TaxID=2854778 RepID=UPI001C48082C|nr:hypothetical protein [Pseudomonas sp. PDM31]MBV7476086.1 hypothetical protein [Pseudomonas sp. PDM31]
MSYEELIEMLERTAMDRKMITYMESALLLRKDSRRAELMVAYSASALQGLLAQGAKYQGLDAMEDLVAQADEIARFMTDKTMRAEFYRE